VASAAYTIVCGIIDIQMKIEALNKLAIVTRCIISNKAMELPGNIVGIEYSAYNLTLSHARMVSRFLEAFGKLHCLLKLALQAVMYKLAYDPSVAGVPYLAYRSS
jgi:hypothetical protein